ncbi:HAMP domain-containing histidine kinase [Candidatus Dependentiae bacterium]|nr:HAMP domain-containing histidine kinase [Candidatus Dependentiae bacterium]
MDLKNFKTYISRLIEQLTTLEKNGGHLNIKIEKFNFYQTDFYDSDISDKKELSELFSKLILKINSIITKCGTLKSDIVQYEKSNAVGLLAGGIAHEFNNILSGISGYLEPIDSGNNKLYIKKIELLISRAEFIVEKLLNLSKNSGTAEIRNFFPENEISSVIDLMNYKFKEANITIETEFINKSKIFFNISDFYSIISNLIINSIDALKNSINGKIIIKTYSDPLWYHITVWDSGEGIKPQVLKNIFNPFYTTKSNGSGLGLSVIHKIIIESGGEISVNSQTNKFTEFKIKIPINFKQTKSSDFTEKSNSNLITHNLNFSKTVLFIDSGRYENFIIKDFLIKNNITVISEPELFSSSNIIIIDSADIDCIKKKLDFPVYENKIIIILMDGRFPDKKIAGFLNKFNFLVKPLSIDELNALMELIINSKPDGFPIYETKNNF